MFLLTYLFSDFLLMGHQLESSRMRNRLEYHFQNINRWRYMLVYGMVMIGQQAVGVWRRIGVTLLLLLPTETLRPMLVWSPLGSRLVRLQAEIRHGYRRGWIIRSRRSWGGCKRITWSTTTAQILKIFLKDFHLSAKWHKDIYFCYTLIFILYVFKFYLDLNIESIIHYYYPLKLLIHW